VDDNSHWILPGKDILPWAGSFKGKQEIANFFTLLHQHWDVTEFTPHDMIERGDTIVTIGTSSGHPRGKSGPITLNPWVHVGKYNAVGKLIFFQEYADTAAMASALS
jgi:ketosteroid isomerase-like protein